MDGKEITPNDIDSLLSHATDTAIRRKAWEASKAIGKEMKPGLINLRELRNKVVQGLGYPDYFTYMVSDYGICLLYTSDAADERSSVDLGGRRIIKKNKKKNNKE
mgnify:CR=1 FL=1